MLQRKNKKKQNLTFEKIFEKYIERFQTGGFTVGEQIKLKNKWKEHPYIQGQSEKYRQFLERLAASDWDLPLRIGSIHTIYPDSQIIGATSNNPGELFLDVYVEYAPGFFAHPFRIPAAIAEIVEAEENNIATSVPRSLRYIRLGMEKHDGSLQPVPKLKLDPYKQD